MVRVGNPVQVPPSRRRVSARSFGVASPPFDPSTIAGLKLWLKADSLSLNNDDPVASYTDSSGLGNHATQTVAGNKPLFKTGVFGSLPAVRFDGTDDWMNLPLVLADSKTIFLVYKFVSVPGAEAGQSVFSIKNAVPEFSEFIPNAITGYQNITLKHDMGAASTASVGYDPVLDTNGHILCHTYNNGTNTAVGSYTIAQEGAQTVVASGALSRVTTDKGSIGARVSSTDVVTSPFNGYHAEMLAYDTVLSVANRNLVGNSLERWGPTWTDV